MAGEAIAVGARPPLRAPGRRARQSLALAASILLHGGGLAAAWLLVALARPALPPGAPPATEVEMIGEEAFERMVSEAGARAAEATLARLDAPPKVLEPVLPQPSLPEPDQPEPDLPALDLPAPLLTERPPEPSLAVPPPPEAVALETPEPSVPLPAPAAALAGLDPPPPPLRRPRLDRSSLGG